MGILSSCLKGSSTDPTPGNVIRQQEAESRRRRQLEAAEKRRRENETRGIRDVERLRKQQQRQLDIERRQEEAMRQNAQQPNLKWQTNA